MLFHHTLKSGCSLSVGLVPSFYAIQILTRSNSFMHNTVRESWVVCEEDEQSQRRRRRKFKEEEEEKLTSIISPSG